MRRAFSQVIVTTSGMLDDSPIIKLLSLLKNENTTLILTGYQAKDTNGNILKRLTLGESDTEIKNIIHH